MTVKCVQHNTHLSAKISPLKLASSSKCAWMRFISTEIALETIFDKRLCWWDGQWRKWSRLAAGEGSRWKVNIGHHEIVAKAHVVFKCEVVHLRLPFCDWFLTYFLKFDYKLIFATLKINSLCWVFLAMRCDAIQSIWTSQIRHVIRSAILLFCYLLPWRNAFFGCVSCLGFIGNLVI